MNFLNIFIWLFIFSFLQVLKLVEDVNRLRDALTGVRESSAVQVHALEEQLEKKNMRIQQLELRLEGSKDLNDVERKLG